MSGLWTGARMLWQVCLDTPTALRYHLFGARSQVRLQTPDASLVAVAQAQPNVRHAELRGDTLYVDLTDPATDNPALIAALVAAGARVQFVTEDHASLEQVYLELLNHDAH